MHFAGGLNAYLANPSAILVLRPVGCDQCGGARSWHVHGCRGRYVSDAGQWVRTQLYRLRCPGCWVTTTLWPDCVLPRLLHGLDTIQQTLGAYLGSAVSYRQVALSWSSAGVPAGERVSTCWGSPAAPSPTPSSIWRWVHRFARGAAAWWSAVVPVLQAQLSHALVVPPCPDYLTAKARTPRKAQQLGQAWHLLYVLGLLLALRGRPLARWPQFLLHHPGLPPRDHSRWFVVASRAPPC